MGHNPYSYVFVFWFKEWVIVLGAQAVAPSSVVVCHATPVRGSIIRATYRLHLFGTLLHTVYTSHGMLRSIFDQCGGQHMQAKSRCLLLLR